MSAFPNPSINKVESRRLRSSAGISIASRMAMIAITTRSSSRVNPLLFCRASLPPFCRLLIRKTFLCCLRRVVNTSFLASGNKCKPIVPLRRNKSILQQLDLLSSLNFSDQQISQHFFALTAPSCKDSSKKELWALNRSFLFRSLKKNFVWAGKSPNIQP